MSFLPLSISSSIRLGDFSGEFFDLLLIWIIDLASVGESTILAFSLVLLIVVVVPSGI